MEMEGHLRDLIRLCHPDKHKDSKRAKEITQWLLELRAEAEA